VLDQGEYGKAKLRHDPSTRSFVLDLDLMRQAMVTATSGDMTEELALLPRLWQYSLLRCSLSSQVDNYPEGLIELLARLGRVQESIGLAEVLTDPKRKIETLIQIGEILSQHSRLTEQQQLITRALEVSRRMKMSEIAIKALIRTKQIENTDILIKKSNETNLHIPSEYWYSQGFSELITGFIHSNQVSEAIRLAQENSYGQRRILVLKEVVKVLISAHKIEDAVILAKEIVNIAMQISNEEQRVISLIEAVKVLYIANDTNSATILAYDVIKIIKSTKTRQYQDILLVDVVNMLTLIKQPELAIDLAIKIN
jgi:hypothetical protein